MYIKMSKNKKYKTTMYKSINKQIHIREEK
jgi:hypothetical protein